VKGEGKTVSIERKEGRFLRNHCNKHQEIENKRRGCAKKREKKSSQREAERSIVEEGNLKLKIIIIHREEVLHAGEDHAQKGWG